MDYLQFPLNILKTSLNNVFANKEPWQISTITASTVLVSIWFYDFLFQDESLSTRAKKTFFKTARKVPKIKAKIDSELKKFREDFQNDISQKTKNIKYITELPRQNKNKEDILKLVDEYLKMGTYKWKEGRVSGSVYYCNDDLVDLVKEVYGKTSYTNPLHPDIFPGLCKMEAEVIRMAAGLFNGDSQVCGTITSGGTESILMACKAYRDYALEVKGIKRPEMVVPISAHAAFDKASQYFKIKIRYAPIDLETTQVNINAIKKMINNNTIMLVGSAPNFPYGTMDDISAISNLGLRYNIPVHVDSCLGGFLTVFMDDAGYPIPVCDFRLPGVTSISADTHKYGFAPKGTSLILYRNIEYLHCQYTKTTDWLGGVYGSPTISGSRAGGSIAACWATMLNFGKEGYVNTTRNIIHTRKYIENSLRRMNGIFIFGEPVTSVVAIGSKVFDIYRLQGALTENGWNLNVLQFPSGLHIAITDLHTQSGVADKFLSDVQSALTEILKNPGVPVEGKMAVYGYAQAIPDRSIVGEVTNCYLDSMLYVPEASKQSST